MSARIFIVAETHLRCFNTSDLKPVAGIQLEMFISSDLRNGFSRLLMRKREVDTMALS